MGTGKVGVLDHGYLWLEDGQFELKIPKDKYYFETKHLKRLKGTNTNLERLIGRALLMEVDWRICDLYVEYAHSKYQPTSRYRWYKAIRLAQLFWKEYTKAEERHMFVKMIKAYGEEEVRQMKRQAKEYVKANRGDRILEFGTTPMRWRCEADRQFCEPFGWTDWRLEFPHD